MKDQYNVTHFQEIRQLRPATGDSDVKINTKGL